MKKNILILLGALVLGVLGLILRPIFRFCPGPTPILKDKQTVSQLSIAIVAHVNEFGTFPPTAPADNADLVRALAGSNARSIAFFEFGDELDASGSYCDTWGQPFHFVTNGTDLIVWSSGPNGMNEHGAQDDIAVRRSVRAFQSVRP